jgi:GT2 family glycosyltransferase
VAPDERVAVVIPAWQSWSTIDAVLDALAGQLSAGDEVVVVESSADGRAAALQADRPWLRVLALPARALPAAARNLGVESTTAPLLAFLDADAVPDPTWLTELRRSIVGVDATGGSIRNGTPYDVVGTASYLLEFLRWSPDAEAPDSLTSCNLMVLREVYEETGGMPSQSWFAEDTIFSYPLMRDGGATFAPSAVVTHLNRTSARALLRHQYRLGQSFREVCRYGAFRPAILGSRWLAPLSGLLRWLMTLRRFPWRDVGVARALPVVLMTTVGLSAWAAGLAIGPPRTGPGRLPSS